MTKPRKLRGDKYYHGTTSNLLPSLMKSGLKRGSFVTDSRAEAEFYANNRAQALARAMHFKGKETGYPRPIVVVVRLPMSGVKGEYAIPRFMAKGKGRYTRYGGVYTILDHVKLKAEKRLNE